MFSNEKPTMAARQKTFGSAGVDMELMELAKKSFSSKSIFTILCVWAEYSRTHRNWTVFCRFHIILREEHKVAWQLSDKW